MVRQILHSKSPNTSSLSSELPQHHTRLKKSYSQSIRQKRTPTYIKAVQQLDTGGPTASLNIDAIRHAVTEQFPDGPASWPLGWVSKCYLGHPYEVHIVDISGHIIQHFKHGSPLPNGMERARSLAASGRYAVIEVFSDRLIAVEHDGSTSVSMG